MTKCLTVKMKSGAEVHVIYAAPEREKDATISKLYVGVGVADSNSYVSTNIAPSDVEKIAAFFTEYLKEADGREIWPDREDYI